MAIGGRPHLKKDAYGNELQLSYLDSAKRYEWDGDNPKYIGIAIPGSQEGEPVWQIQKWVVADGKVTEVLWPKNKEGLVSSHYEFKWSERESLEFL